MLNIASLQAFIAQFMNYFQAIMAIMAMFGAKTPAALAAAADDLAKAHATANEGHAALQTAIRASLGPTK